MNNRGIQKVVLSRDRAAPYNKYNKDNKNNKNNKNNKQMCTQILLADSYK